MADWGRDGLVGPVGLVHEAMATTLAARLRRDLEAAEVHPEHADFSYYKSHLVFDPVDFLAHSLPVVDLARSLLGDDVLLWDSNIPLKRAGSASYFSWHQDAAYWGLDPIDGAVTIWVALSDVTMASGALRYLPGSHTAGLVEHRLAPDGDVMLRRGQRVDDIDETTAVTMELRPGQGVAHHPLLLHGSGPNRSGADRLGVVCVYVRADVHALGRRDSAQMVGGRTPSTRFAVEARIDSSLSDRARAAHREALDRMSGRVVS